MRLDRRSFVLWLATGLGAVACGSPTIPPPGRADGPTPAATPTPASTAELPIERQLGESRRLPIEDAVAAGTAAEDGQAGPAASAGQLSAEAAAENVIPIVTTKAPVLRRRLPPQRIMIPRIAVDSKVVELGTHLDASGALVWETAAFAVGHHRGTANPGENGNMVLSGHISSRSEGDVFRHLPHLDTGDGIVVVTDEQPFLYTVVGKEVVEPQEVRVMEGGKHPVCTLITCVPDGVYTHRLVVSGSLV